MDQPGPAAKAELEGNLQNHDLPSKYIEYDVDTRWNSTYRMLDDGLKAKAQIGRFVSFQPELQSFTNDDWSRLSQIH